MATSVRDALNLINGGRAEEGVQLLRRIASTQDSEALFLLGEMTWAGTLVAQEPGRARLMIEYAAAFGHPEANILATNLLGSGVAGRRDWQAAVARLEAEARALPYRKAAWDLIEAMQLDTNGDPLAVPEPRSLSDQPRVQLFERLLTPAECAYLIDSVEDAFEPSMVYDESQQLVRDTIRTSDGATFDWLSEDPAVHALNRRIAAATGTSYDQGEALQVLRYVPGQEYRPHFDWVDSAANQRLWTALAYLNDGYDGGATKFVRTGLEVRGKSGDVLVFSNAQADGHGDPLAEHAGLAVTSGVKYLATRWIREARWIP
ncbi:MAG: 2OG-Fe(II) oxygenase [Sphingomicrobium sp.]